MSHETRVTVRCPYCGSTRLAGFDVVSCNAQIAYWTRDERGKLAPEWSGETVVMWDGQRENDTRRPYGCTDCGQHLSAGELVADESRPRRKRRKA